MWDQFHKSWLASLASILSDPLQALQNWNSSDQTPCSWNRVTCVNSRVTALSLPNSQLRGLIPYGLGTILFLEKLDLSNNYLNGSLPLSIFNATQLRFLDLSKNLISGVVPETIGMLQSLQFINLSDNELEGTLPATLTTIQNPTVVSFKNNYFSGSLPTGYLNISYNKLSGKIPPQFAEKIPGKATIDFSFNNLTGKVPDSVDFTNQESKSFSGNSYLCGEVTGHDCLIASSPSSSPPAIAAIPDNRTISWS
ncbi:putative LRR receptor-like serine/threonine-protein kinase [Hibiscus syriacus]|uniref:LRR receptor-like serine/threonine-protein kinase n=1 Tax=Hibiscus syriacus TaxID=106335 RepID=A0A6A2ZR42_HIBSY|nr:putative LRR receptor-like serine/threonine-protein kinase [Hibiscus syriacus]